ncbi:NAD(P)/FAD-dependent oxidoreductase [Ruegeria sp. PrR005]|uniref:NAD(P)-binding domain-containing protein n=1 Tax=Ruegeria sp. PrR005 TaxID=2706882 RepID=A0A6B2NQC3_9RHOB|nr:NAD(P)/FAD-dependent oxidoreductase [Ruegeria sp. PrR005]NDW46322.1 NAD(P)-binding domain-containing protein [Ruegeria sp. PrR005]
MNSVFDTIVVGGGQAGLSVSWHLKNAGVEHLVLDRGAIGDTWRNRWESFCLVTPNHLCRLPGFPYDGDDPSGFMGRDEIVDYVERYAASFDPPYRSNVEVRKISTAEEIGRFELVTSEGTLYAKNIVLTVGTHQHPNIPSWHEDLPDDVLRLHSRDYRNSDQLPDGAILVIGSGQSGCQIAEDLHRAGRKVHLAVGNAGRIPRRYRGRDILDWDLVTGYMSMPVHQHPKGTDIRFKAHPHLSGRDGGHTIDLRQMALDGVQLHGKVLGVENGSLVLSDDLDETLDKVDDFCRIEMDGIDKFIEENGLDAPTEDIVPVEWEPTTSDGLLNLVEAGVSTVLYATGFHYDFGWVNLPVFDGRGYPRYKRGITEVPGLYFCGLHWMETQGSGLFFGVGKDAEYVVRHLLDQPAS